jgi:BirA family biotin operon repressor/biotin-[acetyl-CoA-carboxylase] ligase
LINKNTDLIGKVLLEKQELPSTNTFAAELLAKSAPKEGTVILAAFQTGGRGQIGSRWESEAGKNLLTSTILYPTFIAITDQFLLSQMVALTVRQLVEDLTGKTVQVKWPNDVYLEGKKVAGILIQVAISGQQLQSGILGVGLNVNQKVFSPLLPNPTSLVLSTGTTYDLSEVLNHYCVLLEQAYQSLRMKQFKHIRKGYIDHLWGYQQDALYERPNGQQFIGRITGISDSGQLIISHENDDEAFQLKQIRLVRLI